MSRQSAYVRAPVPEARSAARPGSVSHTAASSTPAASASTRRCSRAIQPAPTIPARTTLIRNSAPRERRMAHRVQLTRLIPAEPERTEQPLLLPEKLPGHQGPDPDHLEPVIGVGDDVRVLPEDVEDGEAVRGERADPARGLVP